MPSPYIAYGDSPLRPATKWLIGSAALFLLAFIGLVDYVTGRDFSFTLMYLAPIAIAIWFVGPVPGLVLCFLAAVSSIVVDLFGQARLPVALWNAGVRLGVYLVFYMLLSYLREHKAPGIVARQPRKLVAVGAAFASLALVAAGIIQHQESRSASLRSTIDSSAVGNKTRAAQCPIAELASLVDQALTSSRPLLLGSRDPNGPSCVRISHTGDVQGVMPDSPGDLDGGPGTSMAVLYFFDRQSIKSPLQDFKWHQTRLRTYLQNNIQLNVQAQAISHSLAQKSNELLDAADSWSGLPINIKAAGFTRRDDWLSYCMSALDKAVGEHDVAAVRHWARELAGATFWLEDLLRWRDLLYKNHLAALDFQARCESLFTSAEKLQGNYGPESTMSQFPAGVLGLNGKGNYYEVERQAERLFSMPAERVDEISNNKHLTPSSAWMPPGARDAFLQLRSVLSADNQKTWDLAARTPYEHGYLVNILFRARTAELGNELATALKKFDARNPHAGVNELMGVLMYRGHSFAGMEWGDRFQPQLIEAAAKIKASETDVEALQDAWAWTNHFYQSPADYGVTFTLRDALAQKKLDCVRATDMIAAIFRNAGRTRMGHVRWCSETGGHSVAAYLGSDRSQSKPLLADGLTAPHEAETWPDCYFHGHAWPPGFEANKPPYAMELYVRGIDSYIWAQGYIIRGPNAGWLVSAPVPYSTQFGEASARKVFDGPYPE